MYNEVSKELVFETDRNDVIGNYKIPVSVSNSASSSDYILDDLISPDEIFPDEISPDENSNNAPYFDSEEWEQNKVVTV